MMVFSFRSDIQKYHYETFLTSCVLPHILGVVFTFMFLQYDKLFGGCCECCLGESEKVVFDPEDPETVLVLKDGQVGM